jgi:hypothetical protein
VREKKHKVELDGVGVKLETLLKVVVMLVLACFMILARFPADYLKDFAERYFLQSLKQLAEHFHVDESNPYYSAYVSIKTSLDTAGLILLTFAGVVGALLAARKLYDMLS